ncbi:MAG: LysR family transcriptional regulator [Mesorhizobium sp.]|nr:MAG: LysR family transcriptional regulator [Mesorhizobium sp.]
MAKRLPPLNPLRAFEATARHASLTKAAGELNVTHGAVSHQIKALEQSLGVKLFQRAGQRVKLSPHGAEFLPAVSAAFDGIAAATQRMTRPASTGVLSVSCVPALLLLWMTPRLGSFTAQYPDIQLTLIPSNDARDIRAPHIDVCVHYGDGSWSDCWIRKWSGLELFPVVSPTLINNRPIRSVRDLADHVFLHGDDGREWHTWLAAADALDLELGDSVTARALLARGMLVAPFALSVPAVDDFYVVCRNEMRSAPIVQLFIDWLFAEKEQDEGRADAPVAGRVPSRRKRPALKVIGARAIPGKV